MAPSSILIVSNYRQFVEVFLDACLQLFLELQYSILPNGLSIENLVVQVD